MSLRGWSLGSSNKSKMAAAAIFKLGKMSITLDWIKISAPNFMGRCVTAMRRRARDQKSTREVNSCERPDHNCVGLSDYNRYLN